MADDLMALEKRVATLEAVVAELRARLNSGPGVGLDWRQWAVSDPEAFEEAMRLGREFRKTGRIADEPADAADP